MNRTINCFLNVLKHKILCTLNKIAQPKNGIYMPYLKGCLKLYIE